MFRRSISPVHPESCKETSLSPRERALAVFSGTRDECERVLSRVRDAGLAARLRITDYRAPADPIDPPVLTWSVEVLPAAVKVASRVVLGLDRFPHAA